MDGPIFSFGCFRLVARERVLMKDDVPVRLGSRAFDLLLALIERAGETVNREDLFERVWPDVIVSKVNLRVHIAALRKALGHGQNGNRFIASVAGRGYCFVAGVTQLQSAVPAPHLARYPTAFAIVDLAEIDDPSRIAVAVASAMGCDVPAQESLRFVLAYLQDKEMLLLFANCEHLLSGVTQLTKRLFLKAPLVHVLISSRQTLCPSHLMRPLLHGTS